MFCHSERAARYRGGHMGCEEGDPDMHVILL